jgi:flagellar M-ring protein FliF
MMMGGTTVLVTVGLIVGAFYLNRPAFEPIYVGLERNDITRMGMALADAGIAYDVNTEGTSIMVPIGKTSRARMILAEKGLPNGMNTGYELFDNLGSLGLTAFMQEITRVRALEGEIARSIQTIQGVRGARVHIVLADRGNFRFSEQTPTASVVIRYEGSNPEASSNSIRHLVAAAVPGLLTENVTVLDSAGRLLAAGENPLTNSATSTLGVKSTVENQVADSVYRALAPYLGNMNFRVSVQADLNTDQSQIEETIFDPESRVERSVQIVRSEDASSAQTNGDAVSVEQNIPDQADPASSSSPGSSERSERREETTNYEMNSKRIATVKNGYAINRLSIAVVVNQSRIVEALGGTADPAQIEEKLAEVRKLAVAAAGSSAERGDLVQVTAVEFMEGINGIPLEESGVTSMIGEHMGTFINALTFIGAILLVIFLGLRPLIRSMGAEQQTIEGSVVGELPSLDEPDFNADFGSTMTGDFDGGLGDLPELPSLPASTQSFHQSELLAKMQPSPEERLTMIVDLDEERAATILRRWVRQEAA